MIDSEHHPSSKPLLRKHILRLRDAIPPEEQEKKSFQVTQHLIEVIRSHDFENVMIYFHIGSEVMTHYLLDDLLRENRHVLGPVIKKDRRLEAYRVTNPEKDLFIADFGIPTPDVTRCELYPPESLDCIVVPGIAFDLYGCRIGYGAGYYDRFIARCPQAHTIGAAFGLQIVADAFPQIWDKPVRQIATDQQLINCIRKRTASTGTVSSLRR